jgi:hypothetical protein
MAEFRICNLLEMNEPGVVPARPPSVRRHNLSLVLRYLGNRGPTKSQLLDCRLVAAKPADSHWHHGRPTYRCRHGQTSTRGAGQPRPKTLYIREDHLVDQINIRLGDQGHDGHATLESVWTRSSRVAVALRDSGQFVVCDWSRRWFLRCPSGDPSALPSRPNRRS